MKFTINWCEKKNNDWIVANIINEQGQEIKEVSINRTSKDGKVFPDFDNIMSGGSVEGEPWTSQAGKNYLFTPKPKLEAPAFMKKPNMDRIMEKKSDSIAVAQNNKAKQIEQAQDRSAWMWAKTNASTVLANRQGFASMSNNEIADQILDLATIIYNGEPLRPFE